MDRWTDGWADGQMELVKQYCALHAMQADAWQKPSINAKDI